MDGTHIHFQWSPDFSLAGFRAGASLHSHTLRSREPLALLYRAARGSWALQTLLRYAERRFQASYGTPLDLSRGWWIPPLAPLDAHVLECGQMEAMGLSPFVSLTDHDNIEAALELLALGVGLPVPISIEWTVPIQKTAFHLGVHNLPPLRARSIVRAMQDFTAKPARGVLREILAGLHTIPSVLVVLNHPLWDESGVGAEIHRAALLELLGTCSRHLHAIELNGLRPWAENRQAIQLARTWSKPVVAGGDRHGLEPNVMLNLAATLHFAEFVTQVREGHSTVMIGNRYRAAHWRRILHSVADVVRTYEARALGRRRWSDRVFYRFDNGDVKSFSEIWRGCPPLPVADTPLMVSRFGFE